LFPELLGHPDSVDFGFLPPGRFISGLMQFPVMAATKRARGSQ